MDDVKESEFDTRNADLDILGKLLAEKTAYYMDALKLQPEALREYRIRLKAIYRHISYFTDPDNSLEDEIDSLFKKAEKMETESHDRNRSIALERLEEADDKINELRKEANLALPTKNEVDPENAGVSELEG